jgi:hypothetical protein
MRLTGSAAWTIMDPVMIDMLLSALQALRAGTSSSNISSVWTDFGVEACNPNQVSS